MTEKTAADLPAYPQRSAFKTDAGYLAAVEAWEAMKREAETPQVATPTVGDAVEVPVSGGWATGVVSWVGYDELAARLDNGTQWRGRPSETRPVPKPAARVGDTVTVEGYGDEEFRVIHIAEQTPELRAAGMGPHTYFLKSTKTGAGLHTNRRFTTVKPKPPTSFAKSPRK